MFECSVNGVWMKFDATKSIRTMPIGGGLDERRSRQKDNLILVSSLDAQGPLYTRTKSRYQENAKGP